MKKYKLLDLYCGGGGAALGLKRAGFDYIVGVDIEPQPDYPYHFIQQDVLTLGLAFLQEFDLIWASPECKAFSVCKNFLPGKTVKKYKDLIPETRKLLKAAAVPYIIENVCQAPIRRDLILCGEMFGLRMIRHRKFEIEGFFMLEPPHKPHQGTVKDGDYYTFAGQGNYHGRYLRLDERKKLMGVMHMNKVKTINNAVPPAYSKFIGREFIRQCNIDLKKQTVDMTV